VSTTIRPFLMFDGEAEAAMRFYVSLFPGAEVAELARWGPGEAGAEGKVKTARFTLAGQAFMCIDSSTPHAFTFNPAFSLFVDCGSGAELDRLSYALADGGAVLMPPDDYGFSRKFAWVEDRWGVSWQLNLP
jgi:predicted 3-demethylubiquinone-9 3-methyltransferase (glyoxalase superfamily)